MISIVTIKKVKRKTTECEKMFANNLSDRELVSKIYKELLQLSNKKTTQLKVDKGSKSALLQKDIRMADKHMKRWSVSLVIREIKTSEVPLHNHCNSYNQKDRQ